MKTMSRRLRYAVVPAMIAATNIFRLACAAPTATVSRAGIKNDAAHSPLFAPLRFPGLERHGGEAATSEYRYHDEAALLSPPPHTIVVTLSHAADGDEVVSTSRQAIASASVGDTRGGATLLESAESGRSGRRRGGKGGTGSKGSGLDARRQPASAMHLSGRDYDNAPAKQPRASPPQGATPPASR
jgi:hypothetical protein